MPPAARVSDAHAGPMRTAGVLSIAHVGGARLRRGAPAARMDGTRAGRRTRVLVAPTVMSGG